MKILITGSESAGKSTLSRQLAWALDGVCVPEAAREYLKNLDRPYAFEDLQSIWHRQRDAEAAAVATGASFVVCDTGPEVIRIWSEVKFGRCDPEVFLASRTRSYDLTLLCYPDLPWTYDPLREHPEEKDRKHLFDRYHQLLPNARVISGADRLTQALAAVSERLGRPARVR
ncbi:AAA family ATPase [Lewinella sp. IMCC34183]|uniref:AAA family ATPase n=1 Tax=Lewinella sp. IMCC34183 TaxID=2248762 RepID=UPI000E22BF90|nr:ATP-binding protein [Lewinella sp. IMCC34183]